MSQHPTECACIVCLPLTAAELAGDPTANPAAYPKRPRAPRTAPDPHDKIRLGEWRYPTITEVEARELARALPSAEHRTRNDASTDKLCKGMGRKVEKLCKEMERAGHGHADDLWALAQEGLLVAIQKINVEKIKSVRGFIIKTLYGWLNRASLKEQRLRRVRPIKDQRDGKRYLELENEGLSPQMIDAEVRSESLAAGRKHRRIKTLAAQPQEIATDSVELQGPKPLSQVWYDDDVPIYIEVVADEVAKLFEGEPEEQFMRHFVSVIAPHRRRRPKLRKGAKVEKPKPGDDFYKSRIARDLGLVIHPENATKKQKEAARKRAERQVEKYFGEIEKRYSELPEVRVAKALELPLPKVLTTKYLVSVSKPERLGQNQLDRLLLPAPGPTGPQPA